MTIFDIRAIRQTDKTAFMALCVPYFRELGITEPRAKLERVCVKMMELAAAPQGWLFVAMERTSSNAETGPRLVGFIEFQVDGVWSDWNERPGWGFIRETCVAPQWRGQGVGPQLVRAAEAELRAAGVRSIYLTTETAAKFWTLCGYQDTGAFCPRNEGAIFVKTIC